MTYLVRRMTKNQFNAAEVNVQLGLRYCDGREAIYHQILQHYAEQYQQLPELLTLQQQSLEETIRWLHTLKGHSATIGATALSVRARELQQAWHELEQVELRQRWAELTEQLRKVVAEVLQYIQLYQAPDA